MTAFNRRSFALALAAAGLAGPAFAQSGQARNKPMLIGWENLMPPGEEDVLADLYEEYMKSLGDVGGIAEGSAADQMKQIGTFNTVKPLDGRLVRIPGYVVPLDFNARNALSEFLLAPYFGACVHAPPPPPNQIIFVTAKPAAKLKDLWGAVWAEGVLSTGRKTSSLADAAYTMALTRIEPYEN
jgi:uncharacterized protein